MRTATPSVLEPGNVEQTGHIYRYTSIKPGKPEHIRDIFLENTLWLASVQDFNDPFDGRSTVLLDGNRSELEGRFEKVLAQERPDLVPHERTGEAIRLAEEVMVFRDKPGAREEFERDMYGNFVARVGAICFSGTWQSTLMWSHYADGHKGLCLWFQSFQGPERPTVPGTTVPALRVEYSDNYPVVQYFLDSDEERMEKMFLHKDSAWTYENEYRVLHFDRVHEPCRFPPEALVGVLLGAKMNRGHQAMILNWIEQSGRKIGADFHVYRMELDPDNYRLRRVPL